MRSWCLCKYRHDRHDYLYDIFIVNFRDPGQSSTDFLAVEFNMSALSSLLKKQSEQNPNASYFNVDILKYQVSIFVS